MTFYVYKYWSYWQMQEKGGKALLPSFCISGELEALVLFHYKQWEKIKRKSQGCLRNIRVGNSIPTPSPSLPSPPPLPSPDLLLYIFYWFLFVLR